MTITKNGGTLDAHTFTGLFSSPEPDQDGDTLRSWTFEPELPLLWHHDKNRRVGTAYPHVVAGRLEGRGALFARSHSEAAAHAADVVARGGAGLSIGFLPTTRWTERADGGRDYPAVHVLEVSLTEPGRACCTACQVKQPAALITKATAAGWDPLSDCREFWAAQVADLTERMTPKGLAPDRFERFGPIDPDNYEAHRIERRRLAVMKLFG